MVQQRVILLTRLKMEGTFTFCVFCPLAIDNQEIHREDYTIQAVLNFKFPKPKIHRTFKNWLKWPQEALRRSRNNRCTVNSEVLF